MQAYGMVTKTMSCPSSQVAVSENVKVAEGVGVPVRLCRPQYSVEGSEVPAVPAAGCVKLLLRQKRFCLRLLCKNTWLMHVVGSCSESPNAVVRWRCRDAGHEAVGEIIQALRGERTTEFPITFEVMMQTTLLLSPNNCGVSPMQIATFTSPPYRAKNRRRGRALRLLCSWRCLRSAGFFPWQEVL